MEGKNFRNAALSFTTAFYGGRGSLSHDPSTQQSRLYIYCESTTPTSTIVTVILLQQYAQSEVAKSPVYLDYTTAEATLQR